MQRLTYILLTFLALCTISSAQQPNIIMVIVDDLGYGDVYSLHQNERDDGAGGGIAGNGIIDGSEQLFTVTPHIDRMAAEGAKLSRHYTSAPVCAPARSSLIQGRDQGHATVRNNSFDSAIENNHTLGTVLKTAGYYTAAVGKWGVGGNADPTGVAHPNNRGFDYFYGMMGHADAHNHYPGNNGSVMEQKTKIDSTFVASNPDYNLTDAYSTDLWVAKTKDIIIDRATNHSAQPFFIYLAITAPHARLQVPTQAYPTGRGTTGGLTWPLNTRTGGTQDSYIYPEYTGYDNSPRRHATMVRRIDDGMGDIMQTLRDLGIDNNTLIAFTSDNGPHNEQGIAGNTSQNPTNFDSYGHFEGIKRDMWEGGIRVPTFAWWPGTIGDNNQHTDGFNSQRPSAFWDWMPTFAEAAGLTPPAWSNGTSLVSELSENSTSFEKDYLYFEYQAGGNTPDYNQFPNHGGEARGQMQVIMMDGNDGKRYKGIRTNIADHNSSDFEIYDVDFGDNIDPATDDTGEANNLASSLPELQQAMKDKVLRVRINGNYSRPYSSEYVPSVSKFTEEGLNYKAYTGNFPWVPETGYLTPVASGECNGLDLSQRTQDDDIVLEFTGYISVPADDNYTFNLTADSTISDNRSGAMLWIHDAHIIDDDFNHDGSTKTGSIRLKAGLHPIRVIYKHTAGAHSLSLQYSSSTIAQQEIPLSALRRETTLAEIPVTSDDAASTIGTDPVSIPALANDIDDGLPTPLSLSSVSSPSFGTAVINGGNINYTAAPDKYGIDRFNYTVTDGLNTVHGAIKVTVTVPITNIWLPLDEISGGIVKEAGGQVVGTLQNFANVDDAHIPGKHGHALRFDGSNDQVALTDLPLPTGDSPRTITAWLRTTETAPQEQQNFFAYGKNSNGQRLSCRLDGSRQHLRCEVQNGYIIGSTSLNDGQWHHIAIVIDDFDNNGTTNINEAKLYVDGTLETISGSSGQSMNTDNSIGVYLGGSPHTSAANFNGDIDDLRIFQGALDATAIQELFNTDKLSQAAWQQRHLGTPTVDMAIDTDSDGATLLHEYAFGGSPHGFDKLNQPSIDVSGANFEYTFTRRAPGTHSLTYTTVASIDLDNWNIPTTEVSAIDHPELGQPYQQVTVQTGLDQALTPKQFIRTEVK